MAILRNEPSDLSVEDFRRLGVRPNEFRLHVIRDAAIRSAQALARKQLESPNTQTELQLSRVATSAYRILNPRNREDAQQRVRVGRILPLTLTAAGRPIFQAETASNQAAAVTSFDQANSVQAASVEESEEGLADQFDAQPSESPFAFPSLSDRAVTLDPVQPWQLCLDDHDLLTTSPTIRKFRHVRRRTLSPKWVLPIAATGLMIGTVLGLYTLIKNPSRFIRVADQQATKAITPVPTEPSVPSDEQTASPVVPDRSGQAGDEAIIAEPKLSDDEVAEDQVDNVRMANSLATKAGELPDVTALGDEQDGNSKTLSEAAAVAAELGFAEEFERLQADSTPKAPVAAMASDEGATEQQVAVQATPIANTSASAESKQAESPATLSPQQETPVPANIDAAVVRSDMGNDDADTAQLWPVPAPSDLENALVELGRRFPLINQTFTGREISEAMPELERRQAGLEPGSADHFAMGLVRGSLPWLDSKPSFSTSVVANRETATQTLTTTLAGFDFDLHQTLTESFVMASRYARLPQDHDRIVDNGFEFANYLLVQEQLESCERVLEVIDAAYDFAGTKVRVSGGNGMETSPTLRDLEKTVAKMKRLRSTIDRIEQLEGAIVSLDAEVSGGGSIGRYYCLMANRWDIGLRFLPKTSDPRISTLAKRELDLGESASADDLAGLASQWLAVADREPWREAKSIRLHAIDLLTSASNQLAKDEESNGLKLLEIRKLVEATTMLVN